MQTVGHFFLIGRALCAQACYFRAQGLQRLIMITKCAALGCAASCAGNIVPPLRQGCVGSACHWVAVNNQTCFYGGKLEETALGRLQCEIGNRLVLQMVTGAIVFWNGEVFRELGQV